MDNKITLSVLAQMLADRTGRSRKECEDLLRSFFQTISSTLAVGESVKVRGFGTFKISQVDARMSVDISSGEDYEIPAHNRIVFLPAKELAGAVNAPFEMFETIELADNLSDEDLQNVESDSLSESDTSVEPVIADVSTVSDKDDGSSESVETDKVTEELPADIVTSVSTDPSEDIDKTEMSGETENYELSEESTAKEPAESSVDSEIPISEENTPVGKSSRFGHGFIWGMVVAILLCIAGVGALYFLNDEFNHHFNSMIGRETPSEGKTNVNSTVSEPDSISGSELPVGSLAEMSDIEEVETGLADIVEDTPPVKSQSADNTVPTKPSDQPVYDTVTKTTGLGVMARKHYGNYHFWPYIYKENEKILGHPDRIRPNTRVVIPPLSKYGVNPDNPSDISKAKKLDAEIYARYKRNPK